MAIDLYLKRAAALALIAAALIHAAAAPVHFDLDPLHGSLFAIAAAAQGLFGLWLLVTGSKRVLLASAALNAGVVSVWLVSRTVGVPGIDVPATREAFGYADGAATAFELFVIAVALAAFTFPFPSSRVATRLTLRATSWLAIFGAAIVMLTVPAVSAATHHDHAHVLVAGVHPAGPAGQDLAAHNEHQGSNAVLFGDHSNTKEPCDPTPAQQAAADKLLADTRRDLRRLADVETAKAEGYMRYGDVAIFGTWHYINWEYQAEPDVLNTMKPESIIYWRATPESPMYLIGAMYLVPRADDVGPAVGGCLTTWHVHGEPFAAAGTVTPEMLHVWLIPLPGGPFN